MRYAFYDSEEYRAKQSEITSRNQKNGMYANQKKEVVRVCNREGCKNTFITQPANPKIYCSKGCSATVSNSGRLMSEAAKQKISNALRGKKSPLKGMVHVPRTLSTCLNPSCGKTFLHVRYSVRKYCTQSCAFSMVNSQPTSAKASRGKSGIRPDIDTKSNFHSRWEANMARIYILQGKSWLYEPRTFDIGGQNYTPDFYLQEEDTYVEVKNFWNEYSRIRDEKFRIRYPTIMLSVILKKEYLQLEERYAHQIPGWEFKNSPFDFLSST